MRTLGIARPSGALSYTMTMGKPIASQRRMVSTLTLSGRIITASTLCGPSGKRGACWPPSPLVEAVNIPYPAAAASASTPDNRGVKKSPAIWSMRSPIVDVLCVAKLRALVLGVNWSWLMALSTLAAVSGLTSPLPLTCRLTVATETPASLATSRIVLSGVEAGPVLCFPLIVIILIVEL
jgi:hypothetical protein